MKTKNWVAFSYQSVNMHIMISVTLTQIMLKAKGIFSIMFTIYVKVLN